MIPSGISPSEMLVLGIIALLLFGSKLPDVARNVGQGLAEFKKGMSGFQKEFKTQLNPYRYEEPKNAPAKTRPVAKEAERKVSAPKFELPTTAPTAPASDTSGNPGE